MTNDDDTDKDLSLYPEFDNLEDDPKQWSELFADKKYLRDSVELEYRIKDLEEPFMSTWWQVRQGIDRMLALAKTPEDRKLR